LQCLLAKLRVGTDPWQTRRPPAAAMELAESLVVGLSAVANESQLPDAAFAELIKLVAKDALTDERPGTPAARPRDGPA